MDDLTLLEVLKKYGFDSVKEATRETKMDRGTLNNWRKNKPHQFKLMIQGAIAERRLRQDEKLICLSCKHFFEKL